MTNANKRIRPLPGFMAVVFALAFPAPAYAESLVSSASSTASSAASSASDSLQGSSNSSSPAKTTATGDWRIDALAQAPGRPGKMRLTLHAAQGQAREPLVLDMPEGVVAAQGLAAGRVLALLHRPYGIAFAHAGAAAAREPFFLVLADDWHGEIDARRVAL